MGFVNKSFNDIMTFTRNSSATYTDPTGVIRSVSANVPRFTFNRETGEPLGMLIEEQRTRLNTVSLLPTVPEAVTVTAAQHTISFYGTGSVVLSGAHSTTLTGTGSGRVTLTFTPTAGVLTLTPSGSVNDLQLELGATASSVIRGEGSAQTRLADNVSRTLGDEFNPNEGSFYWEGTLKDLSEKTSAGILGVTVGNNTNAITLMKGSTTNKDVGLRCVWYSGGFNRSVGITTIQHDQLIKALIIYNSLGEFWLSANGAYIKAPVNAESPNTSAWVSSHLGALRTISDNRIANLATKALRYYPRALSQSEAQALTKI